MTLTDGDPRVVAPALFGSVTRLEQRLAEEAFAERLTLAGRNDPEYPDDEPAEHVAAEAIRHAVRRLAVRLTWIVWTVFSGLALATTWWPGLRGPFMVSALLAAASLTVVVRVLVAWRSSQVRRWLRDQPPLSTEPSSSAMPALQGRLGPRQLAPVLMERVTRVEAALVEGFFPGDGTISTGRPRWDGGPRDRVRLRRCFYGTAVFVMVLAGFCGSLFVDNLGSWLVSGFDPDSAPSGLFVIGWVVSVVWFAGRCGQVRRWYRAGVGREAELARRATPLPPPAEPDRRSRAAIAVSLVRDAWRRRHQDA